MTYRLILLPSAEQDLEAHIKAGITSFARLDL